MLQQPLTVDDIRPHLIDPMRTNDREAIYATLHLSDDFDQALCSACAANNVFCQGFHLQTLPKREVAFYDGHDYEQLGATAPCGVNPKALIYELASRLHQLNAAREAAKMPFIAAK